LIHKGPCASNRRRGEHQNSGGYHGSLEWEEKITIGEAYLQKVQVCASIKWDTEENGERRREAKKGRGGVERSEGNKGARVGGVFQQRRPKGRLTENRKKTLSLTQKKAKKITRGE